MGRFTNFRGIIVKALPPQYWKPVFAIIISVVLIMAILWQVEIVSWNEDEFFEFPFFFLVVNKWAARDFWYAMTIPAWLLGSWGFYELGARSVDEFKIAYYQALDELQKQLFILKGYLGEDK
jgi:hypothetical protein